MTAITPDFFLYPHSDQFLLAFQALGGATQSAELRLVLRNEGRQRGSQKSETQLTPRKTRNEMFAMQQ